MELNQNKSDVNAGEPLPSNADKLEIANIESRKKMNKAWEILFLLCTVTAVFFLVILLYQILSVGLPHLSLEFLTSYPSRRPGNAGIKAALAGSIWVMGLTALISFPLGVGAAIYLYEYSPKNRLSRFLELNIGNLAGVPSIVYGMIGLSIFGNIFGFGRTLITGALTLSLLILPVIITSSVEALKTVPDSMRQNALALGVTKWQMITGVVLPFAAPGIATACILAISRGIGEAAPLIVAGAVGMILSTPDSIFSQYTVLPIQIYDWTGRPQADFQNKASAGIIVLLAILLFFNIMAVVIRRKFGKRYE